MACDKVWVGSGEGLSFCATLWFALCSLLTMIYGMDNSDVEKHVILFLAGTAWVMLLHLTLQKCGCLPNRMASQNCIQAVSGFGLVGNAIGVIVVAFGMSPTNLNCWISFELILVCLLYSYMLMFTQCYPKVQTCFKCFEVHDDETPEAVVASTARNDYLYLDAPHIMIDSVTPTLPALNTSTGATSSFTHISPTSSSDEFELNLRQPDSSLIKVSNSGVNLEEVDMINGQHAHMVPTAAEQSLYFGAILENVLTHLVIHYLLQPSEKFLLDVGRMSIGWSYKRAARIVSTMYHSKRLEWSIE